MNQTDSCAAASGRHCRFSNPQKDHFRSEDCRLHRLHHNHHMNIIKSLPITVICFIFHKWQTPIPLHIHLHLKQPCLLQLHWTGSECEIFSLSKVFFSCLSWKEVALGHLHIYTATDPQKLIVNKLPTFCWGHIFISWGGKSWMLIFSVNWTWSISHLENLMFLWWRAKSKWLTHPTITPNHQSCGL